MKQKEIWVEPGTLVFVKHKKDLKALEKLFALCDRLPNKFKTAAEYIKWGEEG